MDKEERYFQEAKEEISKAIACLDQAEWRLSIIEKYAEKGAVNAIAFICQMTLDRLTGEKG